MQWHFVARTLLAIRFGTIIAISLSSFREIDRNNCGASESLIVDGYSSVTQRIVEYEIVDELASLNIKPINESKHCKMIVVADWTVALKSMFEIPKRRFKLSFTK